MLDTITIKGYKSIQSLENFELKNLNTFNEHIKQECESKKFFFYIQPHEFESLLFSDITKIIQTDAKWQENSLERFQEIIRDYENLEFINSARETSPSHRIKLPKEAKQNKAVPQFRTQSRF